MSYNPTKSQQQIIEEKNKGIIVSASAGSGKTSTMIARITNLIKNKKVDVKRLLVLTFTNAAASDMREKLVANLQNEVSSNLIDLDSIFQIASSNISTIDSFCQTLLRKYCYEVAIDPNFNVLDETAQKLLMENAFNNLIVRLWLKKDAVVTSLISAFSEHRKLDDLKNVVFNLYNNFCVMENYTNLLNTTKQSFNKNLKQNISAQYYVNYVNGAIENALNQILTVEPNVSSSKNKIYIEAIKTNVTNLKSENYVDLIEKAKKYFKPKKPSFRSDEINQAESDYVASEIEDVLEEIDEIVKFVNEPTSVSNDVLTTALNYAENIFSLTEQFKMEYFNLKQTRYSLDFSDIEQLALKILENKKIRKEVASEFDYVFVDEYQDVNIMQAKLLDNVSSSDIFAVGDAKQSIYGFRLTSPEIFMVNFNTALNKNGKIKAKVLQENFRSSNAILNFVNFVFEKIMTLKTSKMAYDENAKFITKDNLDFEQNGCPVNIVVVKKYKKKPEIKKCYSVKNDVDLLDNNFKEAEVIANIINNSFKKGYKENDIVLLCRGRSKNVLNIYKKLIEIGYKISMNFDFDIKDTFETSLINNFIYLINNFKSDVYLYSVLKHFYNLTENDFVEIRHYAKDQKFFYEAVLEFEKNNLNSSNLNHAKIANVINKMFIDLSNLILFSENNNVYQVAKKIVSDFNVEAKLSKEPNVNLTNIKKYLNELKKLDTSVSDYAFLTLNTSYKVKADSENDDSITLTTIHASKGLEYKIVILIDAGNEFNYSDIKEQVLIDNSLGITLNGIDIENEVVVDTLPRVSAKKFKSEKLFADELRLLYVALTRAEKELYVVGQLELNKKAESEYQIKKCNNYLSLILSSLSSNKFNELKENGKIVLSSNNVNFAEFTYLDLLETNLKPSVYILPKSSDKIINKYTFLTQQSSVKAFNQILKNTVTRILEDNNSKKYFETHSFSEEEQNESILRGNVYHKFFELFNARAKNLESEASRVLNILNPQEKALINLDYINAFLKNEIIDILKRGIVLKEQKFVFKDNANNLVNNSNNDDEILLQGIIDCLIIENDEITIIDYKTSRSSDIELINRYKLQLQLYGRAVSKILQKKVKKVYLYSVFNANLIEVLE